MKLPTVLAFIGLPLAGGCTAARTPPAVPVPRPIATAANPASSPPAAAVTAPSDEAEFEFSPTNLEMPETRALWRAKLTEGRLSRKRALEILNEVRRVREAARP